MSPVSSTADAATPVPTSALAQGGDVGGSAAVANATEGAALQTASTAAASVSAGGLGGGGQDTTAAPLTREPNCTACKPAGNSATAASAPGWVCRLLSAAATASAVAVAVA